MPLLMRVVPSIGSTATSTSGPPFQSPTSSPLYSIGALSFSPSPITTTPRIGRELIRRRIASTAAPSPPSLSPRPTQPPAAIAAPSVTRTSSSARLLSSSSVLRTRRGVVMVGLLAGISVVQNRRRTGGRAHRHLTVGCRTVTDRVREDGWVTNVPAADHEASQPDTPQGYGDLPARHGRTARDMVISLLVLLIPVAVIFGFVWARGGDSPVVIDPGPAIAEAQAAKAFPVAVAVGLPDGWRPVSAQYSAPDSTLRIGYLTPRGGAVQLIESSAPVDGLLIQELADETRHDGVITAGSASWNAYQVRNGEYALVRPERGRTIIIIGTADSSDMRVLAAALS